MNLTNMCHGLLTARLWVGLLSCLSLSLPAFAATTVVQMGEIATYYNYNPTNVTINAGGTILWTNVGVVVHDTTGRSGLWSSPVVNSGATYSFTFTNVGYYPYYCFFHRLAHPEQTGTVSVVIGGNTPPSVTITNPPNNAVFTAPANVTIQASASDSDGSVTNVQFFNGATSLGSVASAPYGVTVSSLAAGSYTFSAVATDNRNAKATNSVSLIVNSPPSVTVTNPANNAVFTAPATFNLQATASDSDGSVTSVQFFKGSTSLGSVASAPYGVMVSSLAAGSYSLSAVATDNRNAKATNSISISVINSPPSAVTILNPTMNGSAFSFSFATQTGYTYSAQFTPSLNPVSWFTFTNVIGNGSVAQATDSTSTNVHRFYRVGAQ